MHDSHTAAVSDIKNITLTCTTALHPTVAANSAMMCMQVVLCGQSYDATAALFTTSLHHPAVKGCVALYPFW